LTPGDSKAFKALLRNLPIESALATSADLDGDGEHYSHNHSMSVSSPQPRFMHSSSIKRSQSLNASQNRSMSPMSAGGGHLASFGAALSR
jgi:hypothetical protein